MQEDYFGEDYVFGAGQGFNIAVAVYGQFDFEAPEHIDPAYGRIRFLLAQWKIKEYGNIDSWGYKELESHVCSHEELGLTGTDHRFWPIKKSQQEALKFAKNLYLCVDPADLVVQGRTGSTVG